MLSEVPPNPRAKRLKMEGPSLIRMLAKRRDPSYMHRCERMMLEEKYKNLTTCRRRHFLRDHDAPSHHTGSSRSHAAHSAADSDLHIRFRAAKHGTAVGEILVREKDHYLGDHSRISESHPHKSLLRPWSLVEVQHIV